MKTFQDMGLPETLIHTLQHMQFNEPTPIQAEAIPLALEGKDILGSAQTGTGKTAAFGIPLVARILSNDHGSALVMTPTRELATQVLGQIQSLLGRKSKIKSALLIGGDSMPKQLSQLKSRPRIIVGTPGRINDHLNRGSLKLDDTDFLVLDETDRMLDMGFSIQIENVMEYMSAERQTLLFSATLPKNIVRIAEKYLKNPVRVAVSATSAPAANINQEVLRISEADKYSNLISQLDKRQGSVIIFVKTKRVTETMATKLSKAGHSADAIHGDLRQSRRDRVISAFRKQKYRILVATDVAARGLDIPHIEHVINYDLPQCAEDYIHRIGRTARAGAEGSALNLVTPSDRIKWNAIERLLNPNFEPSEHSSQPSNKKPFQKKGRGGKSNDRGFGAKNKHHSKNKSDTYHDSSKDKPRSSDRKSNDWSKDKPRSSDRKSNDWSKDKPRSSDRKSSDWSKDKPRSGDRKSNDWGKDKPRSGDRKSNDWSKDKPRSGDKSGGQDRGKPTSKRPAFKKNDSHWKTSSNGNGAKRKPQKRFNSKRAA